MLRSAGVYNVRRFIENRGDYGEAVTNILQGRYSRLIRHTDVGKTRPCTIHVHEKSLKSSTNDNKLKLFIRLDLHST
jgi:hypothetical protein